MIFNRRELLGPGMAAAWNAAAVAASAAASGSGASAWRSDFPIANERVYLNSASEHPVSIHSARAMKGFVDYLTTDLTRAEWVRKSEDAKSHSGARLREIKSLFAKLINAKPSEIIFVRSTQVGENMVVNGMDIQAGGGNIVTNDLHYESCIHSYKMRQKAGLDVRIVKHRDWQIDIRDMEKVVEKKTKLIATTLVSNVNGLLQDMKAMSDLAHAHGAYLFADIIQGAGAVPIDVKAMGLDFASCSTYKWLMGLRGFGYLYVREDLQHTIVKPAEFSGGVRFNYAPWTSAPQPDLPDIAFTPRTGAGAFEVGNVSHIASLCQYESLQYIQRLGIGNIRAHARRLTTRLQRELPAIGYPCITPKGNESPIVTFLVRNPQATAEKLTKANIEVTLRFGNQMRIAVSVFNSDSDVDRLLQALS
jgi:selenocysteine lyase/cysteine desulfurase